jgi:hypothetical protein
MGIFCKPRVITPEQKVFNFKIKLCMPIMLTELVYKFQRIVKGGLKLNGNQMQVRHTYLVAWT